MTTAEVLKYIPVSERLAFVPAALRERIAMTWRRGKKIRVSCEKCGCEFDALVRRRERGWDRFCSQSCAKSNNASVGNKKRWNTPDKEYKRKNDREELDFKESVRDKADRKCQARGTPEADRKLDVHRQISSRNDGKYSVDNAVALCRSCHVSIERDSHDWKFCESYGHICCLKCGIVRRRDGNNSPCKGPVKVGLRT